MTLGPANLYIEFAYKMKPLKQHCTTFHPHLSQCGEATQDTERRRKASRFDPVRKPFVSEDGEVKFSEEEEPRMKQLLASYSFQKQETDHVRTEG